MSAPVATHPLLVTLAAEQCRNGAPRLEATDVAALVAALPGWTGTSGTLTKSFRFADFDATMAFVNALAFIARSQNHHPDLALHYARCEVSFSTHDAGGLTRNDFICAARTERLFA
ncbi:MAG: 4a-hydroxytetrahydrobiopterin dehydratase [Casimicrobiaceae bacterium]